MSTSIQWNDASFVLHLDQDRYISRTLNDLIRRVVTGRHHRRRAAGINAARSLYDVLDFIVLGAFRASCSCAIRGSLLALSGGRRKFSVCRLSNDRSSEVLCKSGLASIKAELREVVM